MRMAMIRLQEMMMMAKQIGIPMSNLHRIADERFSHINYILNKRRTDYLDHTMDFFKGGNAKWTGHIQT